MHSRAAATGDRAIVAAAIIPERRLAPVETFS
jgi:hypothetical protein